jgi:hypothetical protein
MRGAIPPLPQYVCIVWRLLKHRNNFTFTTKTYGALEVSGQLQILGTLHQGKRQLDRRLGGLQSQSGHSGGKVKKIFAPARNQILANQPIA